MSYDIQAAFGKRTKLNCLNTIEICIPSGNVRMMSEVYFIFGIYLEYFSGKINISSILWYAAMLSLGFNLFSVISAPSSISLSAPSISAFIYVMLSLFEISSTETVSVFACAAFKRYEFLPPFPAKPIVNSSLQIPLFTRVILLILFVYSISFLKLRGAGSTAVILPYSLPEKCKIPLLCRRYKHRDQGNFVFAEP